MRSPVGDQRGRAMDAGHSVRDSGRDAAAGAGAATRPTARRRAEAYRRRGRRDPRRILMTLPDHSRHRGRRPSRGSHRSPGCGERLRRARMNRGQQAWPRLRAEVGDRATPGSWPPGRRRSSAGARPGRRRHPSRGSSRTGWSPRDASDPGRGISAIAAVETAHSGTRSSRSACTEEGDTQAR